MKELPEFIIEMSKRLNEQGNRMTADPLFEVRYKTTLVTESGYNETHWEIIDEDGCSRYHSEKDSNLFDLAEHLFDYHLEWCEHWIEYNDLEIDKDNLTGDSDLVDAFKVLFDDEFDPEWDDLPAEFKKLHMQEIEVTVNSHFTEKDAQSFIDRKQHDYPKLYIYAISLCYCENMTKLRNWIKELTNENN